MHLLVVTDQFPTKSRPDAGLFVARQVLALERQGVSVTVLVARLPEIWPLSESQRWRDYGDRSWRRGDVAARIEPYPFARPPGAWFKPFEGRVKAPGARRVARRVHALHRFDCVLGVDLTASAPVALLLARELGIPAVGLGIGSDVMLRPLRDPLLRAALIRTVSELDHVMCVSRDMCRRVRELCPNAEPSWVMLARQVPEQLSWWDRTALRGALGWRREEVVAIFVGRLTEEKGLPELIEARARVIARGGAFRLVCIGDGPFAGALSRLAKEAGSSPIDVVGRVLPEEVFRYCTASDLMVLPSRSEGLPQVVLEAMECALPVLGTRAGGIPELVADMQTGVLVEVRDVEAFAHQLHSLINQPERRRTLGQLGRRRARSEFDSTRQAEAMVALLHGVKRRLPRV
jgi:glycosyltransferase involved in cell wall biosynthesis